MPCLHWILTPSPLVAHPGQPIGLSSDSCRGKHRTTSASVAILLNQDDTHWERIFRTIRPQPAAPANPAACYTTLATLEVCHVPCGWLRACIQGPRSCKGRYILYVSASSAQSCDYLRNSTPTPHQLHIITAATPCQLHTTCMVRPYADFRRGW
jgi:hypothetical protein